MERRGLRKRAEREYNGTKDARGKGVLDKCRYIYIYICICMYIACIQACICECRRVCVCARTLRGRTCDFVATHCDVSVHFSFLFRLLLLRQCCMLHTHTHTHVLTHTLSHTCATYERFVRVFASFADIIRSCLCQLAHTHTHMESDSSHCSYAMLFNTH